MSSDLAASIVTAPAGAALLAALEFEARRRADPSGARVTATHDGLWTSTQAGDTLAAHQVSAWEIFPGPVTCWTLTVEASARVFEVRAPDDWERLVRSAPLARDRRPNTSWEFPGMDPHNTYDVQPMAQLPNQRAMRPRETFRYFVEPNWDVVAENWDAVHLTWAGFLTTEGLVIDLDDGDVTMLRNWNSERTLWLNPVLHDPRPAPGAHLLGHLSGITGLDVATSSHRGKQDLRWLEHKLDD